jgi:hypothetical protein
VDSEVEARRPKVVDAFASLIHELSVNKAQSS